MATNNTMHQRINMVAFLLALFGLVAGLRADEITSFTPKVRSEATKTLSFPADQWIGNLFLEPESGPGWRPENVMLLGQWDYLSAALGEVRVPDDRHVKLQVRLALSPTEAARLQAQSPGAYQALIASRTRKDPNDLAGLSALDPNDLFWLSVDSTMYGRTGADPRIIEPIHRLTDLEILTLSSTGITDEGLASLRSLRSLKGLHVTLQNRRQGYRLTWPAWPPWRTWPSPVIMPCRPWTWSIWSH